MWQVRQGSTLACCGQPLAQVVPSGAAGGRVSTPGGGGGGAWHSSSETIHLPRLVGEVVSGWLVTVSQPAWVSKPAPAVAASSVDPLELVAQLAARGRP